MWIRVETQACGILNLWLWSLLHTHKWESLIRCKSNFMVWCSHKNHENWYPMINSTFTVSLHVYFYGVSLTQIQTQLLTQNDFLFCLCWVEFLHVDWGRNMHMLHLFYPCFKGEGGILFYPCQCVHNSVFHYSRLKLLTHSSCRYICAVCSGTHFWKNSTTSC